MLNTNRHSEALHAGDVADYRDTVTIPDTLYRVVYAEMFGWEDEPYVFVYSGVYDTLEDAEAFIYNYCEPAREGTYNILEYSLPPF